MKQIINDRDTGSSLPTGIHSHYVGVTYSPEEHPF